MRLPSLLIFVSALSINASAQAENDPDLYICYHEDGRKELTASNKGGNCKKLELPGSTIPKPGSATPKMSNDEAYSYAKRSLARNLVDPESVRFRDLRISKQRDYVCGEFNAKNRQGGYNGFTEFAVRLEKEKFSTTLRQSSSYCDNS